MSAPVVRGHIDGEQRGPYREVVHSHRPVLGAPPDAHDETTERIPCTVVTGHCTVSCAQLRSECSRKPAMIWK
jgi:hypothetical protein